MSHQTNRPRRWFLFACILLGCASGTVLSQPIRESPYTIYVNRYHGYGWGYGWDAAGNYLRGAADVIRAEGQYLIDEQQANLIRQKVRSARIDNRRKSLELWLWQRNTMPTAEDEREVHQEEQLRRSRNDPTITEIWSAVALNELLTDAVKIYSLGARSASVPLKAEVLAKINVTSGRRGGNIGLLKDGRIDWPLLLRRKAFSKERDQTNGLIARAQNQAAQGQIDAEILEDLISAANELQRRLTNLAKTLRDDATWTPTMYLDAKSWLNQLDDALKVLQQPDAAAYLTGKYAARGSTVAELVQYMKHNGLQFAPCLAGGEAAYMALYRALRDYDTEGGSAVRPRR